MRRALVITNSDAGSNDEEAVAAAVAVLHDAGIETEVRATSEPAELTTVLESRGDREVIVAGGDGSLHAVVAALHELGQLADVVLGLIPLGTGNDFARGVALPLSSADAARVIAANGSRSIDLLLDDDEQIVVNAVHAGVGADAGREAQPLKPRLGKVGYAIGAVLAGVKTQGHPLRVVADATVITEGRRVLQVGVGNGAFVGGGTPLAPTADPSDGKVDVVVSYAVSPLDRLRYAVRLKRGTHGASDDVQTLRARRVEVSGPEFWCNADGELVGPYASRSWTVMPQAVTMLLPA